MFERTGSEANPAGRLPVTWPASLDDVRQVYTSVFLRKSIPSFVVSIDALLHSFPSQIPDITNFTMENRTYRYYQGAPLLPFGFGLSYSRFRYSALEVAPQAVAPGANVTVTVTVTNLGPYDGEEVSTEPSGGSGYPGTRPLVRLWKHQGQDSNPKFFSLKWAQISAA